MSCCTRAYLPGRVESRGRSDKAIVVVIAYRIRQLVCSVRGCQLKDIWETKSERLAAMVFADYVARHPAWYFELVKVEHSEVCLSHSGHLRKTIGASE